MGKNGLKWTNMDKKGQYWTNMAIFGSPKDQHDTQNTNMKYTDKERP